MWSDHQRKKLSFLLRCAVRPREINTANNQGKGCRCVVFLRQRVGSFWYWGGAWQREIKVVHLCRLAVGKGGNLKFVAVCISESTQRFKTREDPAPYLQRSWANRVGRFNGKKTMEKNQHTPSPKETAPKVLRGKASPPKRAVLCVGESSRPRTKGAARCVSRFGKGSRRIWACKIILSHLLALVHKGKRWLKRRRN